MRLHPILLALLAVAPVAGQTPAPEPTRKEAPPPCPKTGGLQIGQDRAMAFGMMNRPDVTNTLTVHHAPPKRPYRVDVTFGSTAPEATIVSLDYVFSPPAGVLDGLIQRFGKPEGADAGWTFWRLPACGVKIRYMLVSGPAGPVGEEMWVEPIPPEHAEK